MISLSRRTTLVFGTLAAAMTSTSAFSGDVIRTADHCAIYGSGFVDLGNGTCGQVGRSRIGNTGGWSGGNRSRGTQVGQPGHATRRRQRPPPARPD